MRCGHGLTTLAGVRAALSRSCRVRSVLCWFFRSALTTLSKCGHDPAADALVAHRRSCSVLQHRATVWPQCRCQRSARCMFFSTRARGTPVRNPDCHDSPGHFSCCHLQGRPATQSNLGAPLEVNCDSALQHDLSWTCLCVLSTMNPHEIHISRPYCGKCEFRHQQ